MWADWQTDVQQSARSLARAPSWTAAITLTIAVGIGSSAAVQGFVRGLMTTDLPIAGLSGVVTLFAIDSQGRAGPVSLEVFAALRERRDLFAALGAIRESQERLTIGDRTELVATAVFTEDVRTILPLPAGSGVAFSHRLRSTGVDADPEMSGIRLGAERVAVAGVVPDWLEGLYRGRAIDLWMPQADDRAVPLEGRSWLLGRLAPGVSPSSARAIIADLPTTPGESIEVLPYTGQTPSAATARRRTGTLLGVGATAVFVIACVNVAAFMLVRAMARARETAVRVSLGAARRQLRRQVLAESLLLSSIGGGAGGVLAAWSASAVPLLFYAQDAEHLTFAPDLTAIAMTSVVCMAVTVACGLLPLLDIRDDQPSAVLRREAAGPSRRARHLGVTLTLVQMAGCAALVVSAALLLHGFRTALQTEAGRRLEHAVLATVEAAPNADHVDVLEYFDAAIRAAQAVIPEAEAIWSARLLGSRAAWQSMRVELPRDDRRQLGVTVAALTPSLLKTLTLPPASGRLFGLRDTSGCPAVVINQAAASALFANGAVGRVVDTPTASAEIIGVVHSPATDRPALYIHPEYESPFGAARTGYVYAPPDEPLTSVFLDVNVVSSNYFGGMGLTVTDGRLFDTQPAGDCRIGVVNEEAASLVFGGRAVGSAVIDASGRRIAIVGVVRSVQLRAEQRLVEPTLFLPMSQNALRRMSVVLTGGIVPAPDVSAIRARIAMVPGGRPDRLVVTTLEDHLSQTALAPERIAVVLMMSFAALALGLGGVGLYGLMADTARRRRREFAVRLALGARGWDVVKHVLREGVWQAGAGALLGTAAALLAARWLGTITPGTAWPSLITWLAAPALLTAAVAVASVAPARRALSVELTTIMRET